MAAAQIDIYQFGEREYTPLEMVDNDLEYPMIVKVKHGYYGNSWEVLSAGEILLVHQCERQMRIIVSDSKHRHFSMATSYIAKCYPINKQRKRIEKEPKSLSQLVEKFPIPFDIEVESCELTSGDSSLMKLSHVTVTDTYEEKFLNANLIRPEGLSKHPRKIATYVNARLVVSQNKEVVQKAFEAAVSAGIQLTPADRDQRILMFTPRQIEQKKEETAENIYETLEPNKLLSTQKVYDTISKSSSSTETVNMGDIYSSVIDQVASRLRTNSSAKPVVPVKPKKRDTGSCTQWKDIPTDAKTLSCEQVISSLRLLNMAKYEDTFRQNNVDGELLVTLDKEDFTQDLGLSGLDAKKLMLFSRESWRPKEDVVPVYGDHKASTNA